MSKISYEEFRQKLMDIDVSDAEIRRYLTVDPQHTSAFNPRFVTDPEKVAVSPDELELESAMGMGNTLSRWRRHNRFRHAIDDEDPRTVLVSEGDSWFQFPFLIEDVIDHLGNDYLIWSLGAAGDTAANMTGNNGEYMRGLHRWAGQVKGFLFSAAGNDVIGQDASGQPVLANLLKGYQAGQSAAWHIRRAEFDATVELLHIAYSRVITTIRSDQRFATLPIFIHGYDYPFPFPADSHDNRNPTYAASNEWLGAPFAQRGFPEEPFRREVVKVMIDGLYAMMHELAAEIDHVHVVDVRGSMPTRDLWADEIHGTDVGFAKVAGRFRAEIGPLIS